MSSTPFLDASNAWTKGEFAAFESLFLAAGGFIPCACGAISEAEDSYLHFSKAIDGQPSKRSSLTSPQHNPYG